MSHEFRQEYDMSNPDDIDRFAREQAVSIVDDRLRLNQAVQDGKLAIQTVFHKYQRLEDMRIQFDRIVARFFQAHKEGKV